MKKSCEDGAHIMNHALLKTILHFASVQKGAQKKKTKKERIASIVGILYLTLLEKVCVLNAECPLYSKILTTSK